MRNSIVLHTGDQIDLRDAIAWYILATDDIVHVAKRSRPSVDDRLIHEYVFRQVSGEEGCLHLFEGVEAPDMMMAQHIVGMVEQIEDHGVDLSSPWYRAGIIVHAAGTSHAANALSQIGFSEEHCTDMASLAVINRFGESANDYLTRIEGDTLARGIANVILLIREAIEEARNG